MDDTVMYPECSICNRQFCDDCPTFENYNKENNLANYEVPITTNVVFVSECSNKVKSDGGSSSYYTFTIPRLGQVETEEVIKYMVDNDFDLGNILKCSRRVSEYKQGRGKEGNDILYELNKMKYTINKMIAEVTR